MASGLLTAVVAMGGCFVPQDYRFSDDPPPFKNNPIKVVLPTEPAQATITTYNGQGGGRPCQLMFRVSASDPDLNDPITVRWYVDYDPELNPGTHDEELLQNLGAEVRGPSTLGLDLGAPGSPLFSQGTHVVEALVADGLVVDREPQPKSTDPDAGVNPSFVDRFVWIVKTQPGDCPQ